MSRYPKYKPSRIAWLGDIPENWGILRSDWVLNMIKDSISREELQGKEVFHYSIPSIQEHGTGLIENGSEIDSNKTQIRGMELLVSKLNPRKAIVVISEPKEQLTVCSTEFVVLVPEKVEIRFAFYLYLSHQTRERICATVQSATYSHQRANPADIVKIWNAFPPLPEQQAIATYLDDRTRKIDALIEKKQRLIELLKEQRAAVINQAVTKGINPDVKVKDSGIEWIGEIPEHWKIKRLKHVSNTISKGTTPSTIGRETFSSGSIRFIKAENIVHNDVSAEPEFFIDEETNRSLARSQLEQNDILFVIAGATIGKVAVLNKTMLPANTNQAVCFIRLKQSENHAFIWYWLQSSRISELTWLDAVQSAQPNISMESISSFYLAYPPLDEQREIVRVISSALSKATDTLNRIDKEILLLQEYRTALISEVVTGKIDVRDYVIGKKN